jgi:hypothetical protein
MDGRRWLLVGMASINLDLPVMHRFDQGKDVFRWRSGLDVMARTGNVTATQYEHGSIRPVFKSTGVSSIGPKDD